MAKRSRHRIKHKAEVEVKRISEVRLIVDADREAENFEIVERDANEATLQLHFGDDIV